MDSSNSTAFDTNSGDTPCEDEPMLPVNDAEDLADGDVPTPCDDEPMLAVDESDDDDDPAPIPDDAIYSILIRLPPSSVTRSKVTCKSWLSMISGRSFKRDHRAAWSRRAPATSILLFDGGARYPATVVGEAGAAARLALRRWRAEPRHGYTVQNCCGALACLRTGHGDAQLLNPATGQSKSLSYPRHGDRATWTVAEHLPWFCLGRCAATGEYKVVGLDVRVPFSGRPHVTCHVLALGRDSWEWDRRGRFTPRWKEVGIWHVNYCPADRGVHVAGVVYYLAWFFVSSVVVGIDLSTHERSEMDLPLLPADSGVDVVASLSELGGRLCVSLVPSGGAAGRDAAGSAMRLYVLVGDGPQGGGGKTWSPMYRFGLDDGIARRVPRPLLVRGRRMLGKRADGSLCWYDMDEAGGEGAAAAADEEVVFEHTGGRRRRQQLSGVTADVFEESLLSLRAILIRAYIYPKRTL